MLQSSSQCFSLGLVDIFIPNRCVRHFRKRAGVRGLRNKQASSYFDQLLRGIAGGF